MSLILHYHPLSSFCWKVLIALYENGAPFEKRIVNFGDSEERAAYVKLWPTGKIPLLVDGGRVVPETSIMIEYFDRKYPGALRLLPDDPGAQLEVRLWDRVFDHYVMHPMQRFIDQELRQPAERDARAVADSVKQLQSAYAMIDDKVRGHVWSCGDHFTMADCAAAPSLFYAAIVTPFAEEQTTLWDYFERLMARPSVRRVIVEARPFFQYYPLRHAMPARFLADDVNAG